MDFFLGELEKTFASLATASQYNSAKNTKVLDKWLYQCYTHSI